MTRPSIYDFTDFRLFLSTMFAFKKKTVKSFSYRNFSRLAGFSSPNFLKLVMDCKRNLTHTSIAKIAKGFKLKKQEREFFENLVFMNQAQDHEQKDYYYRKMLALKARKDIRKLEQAQYEYFSRWYYPAIRELILFEDNSLTSDQISDILNPPVTKKEVEKALAHMQAISLIDRDENGRWKQSDAIVSTGSEVKSLLIANFHHEMIKLADESIERYSAEERDITALTMSIDKEKIGELKQKLSDFRKELLSTFATEKNPDLVIQVNLQMFPLTLTEKKGK